MSKEDRSSYIPYTGAPLIAPHRPPSEVGSHHRVFALIPLAVYRLRRADAQSLHHLPSQYLHYRVYHGPYR